MSVWHCRVDPKTKELSYMQQAGAQADVLEWAKHINMRTYKVDEPINGCHCGHFDVGSYHEGKGTVSETYHLSVNVVVVKFV